MLGAAESKGASPPPRAKKECWAKRDFATSGKNKKKRVMGEEREEEGEEEGKEVEGEKYAFLRFAKNIAPVLCMHR